MKILVLNVYSRNALAVIESIDKSYDIYGSVAFRGGLKEKLCKILRSKSLKDLVYITPPSVDSIRFKNDLIDVVNKLEINVVIPTGTLFTDHLSLHKEEITARTNAHILVEDFTKLEQLTDKWRFVQLCSSAGVPVPKTSLIQRPEKLDEERRQAGIDYPFIVKPRRSQASEGVFIFKSEKDFENNFPKFVNENSEVNEGSLLIQELISGTLHDVTCCSKAGLPLSMLTQQRMATWYDFGGGGIVNMTTREEKILNYIRKVIEKISWNGIAEFDFIKDANGDYFILECNPKFWGTTQLTVDAGLNMPQQLIDFWVLGKEVKPLTTYKTNLLYKWLLPYCFVHCIRKPLTINLFCKRVKKICKTHGCSDVRSNIKLKYIRHILGSIVINTPL